MNLPTIEYTTKDTATTEQRLENWRNWARDHRKYRVTPSLEGRYRPPPSWHPPEPKIFVDILDAIKVEKALVAMPQPYKQVLIYRYIYPFLNFNAFCRKASIHQSKFNEYERRAICMLHNRLMRAEIFSQDVAQNKKP
jgi:hypothetical protein